MRILGLIWDDPQNIDVSTGQGGIFANLFGVLSRNHEIMLKDIRVKSLTKNRINKVISLLTNRENWRRHALLNNWRFKEMSKIAHRETLRLIDSIDLVFQFGGLSAPFVDAPLKPYVLYLDYTTKLAELNYPQWFPFKSLKAKKKWYVNERQLYQLASKIFTYSDLVRRSITEHYGVEADKVVKVGAGVTLEPISESKPKSYESKQIIFIGKDAAFERKGGPQLLQAFELVKEKIRDAQLVLVGLSEKRQISQEGVINLGFIRERSKIKQLLEEASVFLMPSICEPWGLVFLEAMAYKLPCIGTSTDAMPEIIQDGHTGFIVPRNDHKALADRIITLLSDEELMRKMGERGYERIKSTFTWDQVVAKMEEHLQQVVVQ
jgi:glycosyltransferase involved in cell wall biosynthesis